MLPPIALMNQAWDLAKRLKAKTRAAYAALESDPDGEREARESGLSDAIVEASCYALMLDTLADAALDGKDVAHELRRVCTEAEAAEQKLGILG